MRRLWPEPSSRPFASKIAAPIGRPPSASPLRASLMATASISASVIRVRRNLWSHCCHGDLLILVLKLIQLVINAVFSEQLLVRAHFAKLRLVHDDDLIGALHCREAVGDDDRRAALDHLV